MKSEYLDVTIIGGGPAGMAAAASAAESGASVALIEREGELGGILKQCIHDGFGLFRFGKALTGPEYAFRDSEKLKALPVRIYTSTFLTSLKKDEKGHFRMIFTSPRGLLEIRSPAVVSATGCRERSGRQIFLHGERPSGIFTAGQAQAFVNLKGFLPGRRSLILGSGDIGLIMARRLTLEGAEVLGVYEVKSEPSGLTRNLVQCLEDFDIPLHLSTTVKRIHGRGRIEGVTVCRVDETMKEIPGTERKIACDSLILSVGLIPENEIIEELNPVMDRVTGGPESDQRQMTSVPGFFICGNAQHVNDLVDYVSESGESAGREAAFYSRGNQGNKSSRGSKGRKNRKASLPCSGSG